MDSTTLLWAVTIDTIYYGYVVIVSMLLHWRSIYIIVKLLVT